MKIKQKIIYGTLIASIIAWYLVTLTTKALGLSQEGEEAAGTALIGKEAGQYIGAGLAVGLAGIGAGAGMGPTSAAAIGAISEKEEMFGTSLIFVVLIEAVAIYGLLIALLLIFAIA
ncbi:MAG: V-type ATP synthase subunit K [Candidatus Heimdallarchaeota archaeon]|nr:V-type ATP synthase subunit K [Candidatus Heimdallarchaeota archaeon]